MARNTNGYFRPAFFILSTTLEPRSFPSQLFLYCSLFFYFLVYSSLSPGSLLHPPPPPPPPTFVLSTTGMFATLELPIRGITDRLDNTHTNTNINSSLRAALDDSRHKRLKVGRACQPCRMKKIKVQDFSFSMCLSISL